MKDDQMHTKQATQFAEVGYYFHPGVREILISGFNTVNKNPEVGIHDMMLNCGGTSFEEAFIKRARRVEQYCGDDHPEEWDELLFCVYKCDE